MYVGVYRQVSDQQAWRLASAAHLVDFGYFTRGSIAQHVQFAGRTVVQRTRAGSRQTIQFDEQMPFVAHVFVRSDGLAGVVMADREYPPRVAYSLLSKEIAAFEERLGVNWFHAANNHTVIVLLTIDTVPVTMTTPLMVIACCAALLFRRSMDCDQDSEPDYMKADILQYQDPRTADQLTAVQSQLDEVTNIMQTNIDQLLQRGETLDTLMVRSDDLGQASIQFYRQARSANACCRY